MGEATLVVVPSECYETFGRVAIEAFAKGTPVVAADHGAVAEIVAQGEAAGCSRGAARKTSRGRSRPCSMTRRPSPRCAREPGRSSRPGIPPRRTTSS